MKTYQEEFIATLDEFPKFRVRKKSASALMWTFRILLFPFNRTFFSNYVTTIGSTMYVPLGFESWDDYRKASILRHERVHLRQRRRLGAFVYTFTYLVWPIPLLFAAGRYRLEREAYEETIRARLEGLGPEAVCSPGYRARVVGYFTSSAYLWTWIRRRDVERWFDDFVEGLLLHEGFNPRSSD